MNDKLKMFSLKPEAVELDNGQTVYLRRLTALDRIEWIEMLADRAAEGKASEDILNYSARLLVLSLCSADGQRMLEDGDEAEVKQLDHVTFERLSNIAVRINRLSEASKEEVEKK